jgi:dCTP deaminase
MTVLHDSAIRWLAQEQGMIVPFDEDLLQPASIDVTLAAEILRPARTWSNALVDSEDPSTLPMESVVISDFYVLGHGEFVLGSTVESVRIPRDVVGRLSGKSSRARVGLQIESAGYLDPGFRGNVTLEIVNFLPCSIAIRAGMRVGQLSFEYLDAACERAYGERGNRYQDSVGVVAGRAENKYRQSAGDGRIGTV